MSENEIMTMEEEFGVTGSEKVRRDCESKNASRFQSSEKAKSVSLKTSMWNHSFP